MTDLLTHGQNLVHMSATSAAARGGCHNCDRSRSCSIDFARRTRQSVVHNDSAHLWLPPVLRLSGSQIWAARACVIRTRLEWRKSDPCQVSSAIVGSPCDLVKPGTETVTDGSAVTLEELTLGSEGYPCRSYTSVSAREYYTYSKSSISGKALLTQMALLAQMAGPGDVSV